MHRHLSRTRTFARPAMRRALLVPMLVALAAAGGGIAANHESTALGAPATAGAACVRLNQIGYPTASPKYAYVMSRVPASTATFAVRAGDGTPVLMGHVGTSFGSWSAAFGYVYGVDFSALTAPGVYRISIGGPVHAVSPEFRVGAGRQLYRAALRNTLRFYQVQRDGPHFVRSRLRTAAAHLHDRHAMTYGTPRVNGDGVFRGDLSPLGKRIDASGGWWDAGDYLKFLHTTAYTETVLLAGIRDFPSQMGGLSATSDFRAEARFGAGWLLRMWDDKTRTLYYQVGIGSGNARTAGDHDIWRLPQRDDTWRAGDARYRYIRHRPVFRLGPGGTRISPNLAGRDAAALALAYQVYRASAPGFAARCLRAAAHIYDLADPSPTRLVTAIPYDYYPEAEWRDDMELGGTELYLALTAGVSPSSLPSGAPSPLPSGLPHTDPAFYLDQAARWARAYMAGPNDAADTLNLYDVSGLAHYDLVRAMRSAGDPAGLDVTEAQVLGDMKRALDGAVATALADPFRFGYGWAQWDTATHGAGSAVMAGEYDQLTGTTEYAEWGSRWLGAILGANAWGTSFIVGAGTTYPHCLQHAVANLRGTLDGTAPVLLGACVEGPNAEQASDGMPGMRVGPRRDRFKQFNGGGGAKWRDAVQNYPNTEPAIDLTAGTALAFAREMAGP